MNACLSKTQWLYLLSTLLAGVLLAIWIGRSFAGPGITVNNTSFDKLQVGMTLKSIQEMLGGPPGNYTTSQVTPIGIKRIIGLDHPQEEVIEKPNYQVVITLDVVIPEGYKKREWAGNDGLISVFLDKNDLLWRATFQEYQIENPSFLHRVFGWLGFR